MPVHDPDGEIGMAFDSISARLNRQQPAVEVEYQKAVLELCGRARVLAQKVAALEAPTTLREWADGLARTVDASAEMDRLRAENAELQAKLSAARASTDAADDSAELVQNVVAAAISVVKHGHSLDDFLIDDVNALMAGQKNENPPERGQWPAPQPIETAPLGRILVVFEAGQMEVIRPVKVDTESSWREFLKMNKATHWWPVPPPPGGGK